MIELSIRTQPDDETCGPTCLHAIYQYFNFPMPLDDVIQGIDRSRSGGTLAPILGKHALSNGFSANIYVNNVEVFDPTWFVHGTVSSETLYNKLNEQLIYKNKNHIQEESVAYQAFLEMGGTISFRTIDVKLLQSYFKQNIPILTGLSATYLYRCAREVYTSDGRSVYDDIKGAPCGHFVVLCGYNDHNRRIVVADPHRANPLSHDNYYNVSSHRLINAIMLGVLTYDANLLIIQPKELECKHLL